jgi:TIR domain
MTLPSSEDSKDFFISYNQGDRHWAEWLAWTLEKAGYSVVIDAWDFRPGGNFVLEMEKAERSRKTIAVLSDHYLQAVYTQSEWTAAFAKDPTGKDRRLMTVRVSPCEPEGRLGLIKN